jgi:hypothetical protein
MSKFDRRFKRSVDRCGVTGKRMFKSPNAAMQFVSSLGTECNAPTMRAYHCFQCGGYHLTSHAYDPVKRYADYKRHQSSFSQCQPEQSSILPQYHHGQRF